MIPAFTGSRGLFKCYCISPLKSFGDLQYILLVSWDLTYSGQNILASLEAEQSYLYVSAWSLLFSFFSF